MKKVIIPVVFILVLSLILAGCSSNSSSAPATATSGPTSTPATSPASGTTQTLDIGEIESLTGMFSDFMKYTPQGAQIAEAYINDNGGVTINGQKYNVNLILEDNKSDPGASATAANDLILNKHVKFIAGTGPTPLVIAIDQVTEKAGVLYCSQYSNGTAAEIGANLPLKFIGSNGTFSAIKAALIYLKQTYPNVTNFAFIQTDDGQIQYDTPEMPKLTSGLGLTLKGSIIGVAPTVTDYTPYAQKAVSLGADAIILGNMSTATGGQLIQDIRGLGYTGPMGMGSFPIMSDIMGVAGAANTEGFFGLGLPPDPTISGLPQITQDVVKMELAKYNVSNSLQYQGFESVYSLVEAIQNAQSLDPKVVAADWAKMTSINTMYGPGKMGGLQTFGANHDVYMQEPIESIVNGKVQFEGFIPMSQIYMP